MNAENAKQLVGQRAAELVDNGMRVGLGTGSTTNFFIDALSERKLDIICVPTSKASELRAREKGLKLATLDEVPELDITIDGADEIGPHLSLIKGGGAALLFEKIVAFASKKMIVIADESKIVETLGRFPLPIEVMPFGLGATKLAIETVCKKLDLSGEIKLRKTKTDETLVTDGGHFILDAHLQKIPDPQAFAAMLSSIPGVVEHGLFLNMTSYALIAGENSVREITI
ncbi:MAG: ribose-5-phosphate isomerase RpiA [Pseudomonadota bacterium]